MNNILGFGEFISNKRKLLGKTLRGMAKELEIAPAYLSDIEKGRRYPPNLDRLMWMVKILKLTQDEKHTMFDLAGESKHTIAPNLTEYIMLSKIIREVLRKAREVADDGDWEEFIEKLNRKQQKV